MICVSGRGVYALRKHMQKSVRREVPERARSSLASGLRTLRRFILRATGTVVAGVSLGGICAAAGLANVAGGALCAIAALSGGAMFPTLLGVAPFFLRPAMPVSVGTFITNEFESTVNDMRLRLAVPGSSLDQRLTTVAI